MTKAVGAFTPLLIPLIIFISFLIFSQSMVSMGLGELTGNAASPVVEVSNIVHDYVTTPPQDMEGNVARDIPRNR